jgi:hypothetical protein
VRLYSRDGATAAIAAAAAESGAAGHEIMAVSGHHQLLMIELYTEDANRKKLADSAMRKRIAEESGNPRRAVNGYPVENIDE